MKALITTIALASTLATGAASAATNFNVNQLGGGTTIQTTSHYSSHELVTVDSANLPSHGFNAELFVGNK